jgi:uncharacterized protein YlxP (DUF503 family)
VIGEWGGAGGFVSRLRASREESAGPRDNVWREGRRYGTVGGVYTGSLAIDLVLGDVRSLKQKRSVVRPIVAELRRKFEVAAAEAGHLELHRRALVGVAVVAADLSHCERVLNSAVRLVSDRPEITVLSSRLRYYSMEDE